MHTRQAAPGTCTLPASHHPDQHPRPEASAPFHAVPSWLFPSASVFALLHTVYILYHGTRSARFLSNSVRLASHPYKFVPIRREQKGNKYGSSLLHIVRLLYRVHRHHTIAVDSTLCPAISYALVSPLRAIPLQNIPYRAFQHYIPQSSQKAASVRS